MRLAELVETSRRVADTSSRLEKIDALARLLRRLAPEEIDIAIAFLSGSTRQGRIGVGWSVLREARSISPADAPTLELRDVDQAFARIGSISGTGSARER